MLGDRSFKTLSRSPEILLASEQLEVEYLNLIAKLLNLQH